MLDNINATCAIWSRVLVFNHIMFNQSTFVQFVPKHIPQNRRDLHLSVVWYIFLRVDSPSFVTLTARQSYLVTFRWLTHAFFGAYISTLIASGRMVVETPTYPLDLTSSP